MFTSVSFPGGNGCIRPAPIKVAETHGAEFAYYLSPDLRDTTQNWFYWAFCVVGAEGKTVYFDMTPDRWVGYYGPAVSKDLEHWQWADLSGRGRMTDDMHGFIYSFAPEEKRVYFAHDMLYRPRRLKKLAEELSLVPEKFSITENGHELPCFRIGEGKYGILLTARHHCCESTGSYVLEGVLREILKNPIPNVFFTVIPMVDLDGVLYGDQGKNRAPHDHNRDYIDEPIYEVNRDIVKLYKQQNIRYLFDFHSPWHYGENNDRAFIVEKRTEDSKKYAEFGNMLREETEADPLSFEFTNCYNMAPDTGWNISSGMVSSSTGYANSLYQIDLAFSLETTYFGTPEGKLPKGRISQDGAVRLGQAFARALKRYLNENIIEE